MHEILAEVDWGSFRSMHKGHISGSRIDKNKAKKNRITRVAFILINGLNHTFETQTRFFLQFHIFRNVPTCSFYLLQTWPQFEQNFCTPQYVSFLKYYIYYYMYYPLIENKSIKVIFRCLQLYSTCLFGTTYILCTINPANNMIINSGDNRFYWTAL